MTIKTTFAAAILVLAPTFAMAECNWGAHKMDTTASTCAEGQTLDSATGTCVDITTG